MSYTVDQYKVYHGEQLIGIYRITNLGTAVFQAEYDPPEEICAKLSDSP